MNTLKMILSLLINAIAVVYFIVRGMVSWEYAAATAIGGIIGGYGGAHLAQRMSQGRVRALIVAIGLIISAVMFYRQFGSGL